MEGASLAACDQVWWHIRQQPNFPSVLPNKRHGPGNSVRVKLTSSNSSRRVLSASPANLPRQSAPLRANSVTGVLLLWLQAPANALATSVFPVPEMHILQRVAVSLPQRQVAASLLELSCSLTVDESSCMSGEEAGEARQIKGSMPSLAMVLVTVSQRLRYAAWPCCRNPYCFLIRQLLPDQAGRACRQPLCCVPITTPYVLAVNQFTSGSSCQCS